MELNHGNPSEEQWARADCDAHGKCREWGYEEAEVTGTRHYEYRGESSREYQCLGRIPASSSQAPSHIMVDSFRELGTISMELSHGNPSEEQWARADSDAHGKCREWGYEEAEVTGTRHYEYVGESSREYQCLGRISTSAQELKSEQNAEIKAWNDALEQDQVPEGLDITNMTLVSRHGDNRRIYIDQSTMRSMPGNKARLQTVTFELIEQQSSPAIVSHYFEFHCRDETVRDLAIVAYDIEGKFLYDDNWPSEWEYVPPNTIGFSMLLTACNMAE